MPEAAPTFPPLLNGHNVSSKERPLDRARARAMSGEWGAGDLVWSQAINRLDFALVLEPEVDRARCAEMVYVTMVAFGDAAGALIPPEVAITYQWPNVIQMNDGQIGQVDLIVSDEEVDGIPLWMVLNLEILLTPDVADMNPGENYHRTTMWDEGCGEITRTEILESTSRHLVNVIHTWSEDGFKPVHELWQGRLSKEEALARSLVDSRSIPDGARFIGVDEIGNGLLSFKDQTKPYAVVEILNDLRRQAKIAS